MNYSTKPMKTQKTPLKFNKDWLIAHNVAPADINLMLRKMRAPKIMSNVSNPIRK